MNNLDNDNTTQSSDKIHSNDVVVNMFKLKNIKVYTMKPNEIMKKKTITKIAIGKKGSNILPFFPFSLSLSRK